MGRRIAYDAKAMPGTTLVVAGGPQLDPLPTAFSSFTRCIAADSGADACRALGIAVDWIVGDLDSISPEALAYYEAQGVPVDRHPVAKDKTDLELALDLACSEYPDRLLVVGLGGGRLDHLVANLQVLAAAAGPGLPVEAAIGHALMVAFVERIELRGRVGEPISLLPFFGDAEGITTDGLQYRLQDESLATGTGRGVSNVFTQANAVVEVGNGVLVAVQPEALAERRNPITGNSIPATGGADG